MTELSELGLRNAKKAEIDAMISDEDIRGSVDNAKIHSGDLTVDGDLSLAEGEAVIVTGNLDVKGEVATDETATLIVRGNLTARHLFLEGNLEVHGNATLRGVVYGFYEAGISNVYGRTKAQIGLIGNHAFTCEEESYELDIKFENNLKVTKGDPEKLRALMGEEDFRHIARLLGVSEEDPPQGNAAWSLRPFARIAP